MKKLIFTLTVILFSSFLSYGQWSSSGGDVYLTNPADWVGIGTSSPHVPLTVFGSSSFIGGGNVAIGSTFSSNRLGVAGAVAIGSNYAASFGPVAPSNGLIVEGNVGIGFTSPSQKLDVNGIININSDNAPAGNGLAFGDYFSGGYKWIQSFESQNLAINPLGNNVGIGTTSPLEKLHIVGDLLIGSDVISTANFTGLKLQYNSSFGEGAIISSYDDGFAFLTFYTKEGSGLPVTERLRIDKIGNVGIGTTTPTQTLDINGKVRIRDISLDNSKDSVLVACGDGTLAYRDASSLTAAESDPLYAASVAASITGIDTSNWNNKLDVETDPLFGASVAAGIAGIDISNWNNKLDVEIDPEVGSNTLNSIPKWDGTALVSGSISDVLGNIGIGTSGPSQKLDINGKLRIRDLILDNSKDSLLVASGNGTLSFRSATSLTGSGFWGALGNDISNNNTGYVGIGIVTPTQKLDVNGKVRIRDLVLDNTKDSVLVAGGDGTVAYRDASGLIVAGTGLTKSGNLINAIGSSTIIANANNLEVNSSATANQVLLSSGSVGFSATFGSIPLGDNNAVTGTLNVANGGTGSTSFTSGNFLQGAGGSAIISTKAVPAGDVVGTIDTQTLTNKTINTAGNTISISTSDVIAGTFSDARIASSNITQHEGSITIGNLIGAPTGSVVGISDTQILTNKTLIDASTYLADNADFTKKVQFQLSDIITGTTRTLTVPDANTTLVGTDVTQILNNKTINTSSNIITVDAADVTTGTFNDARIGASNVTQHESVLTITESQISDLSHFTAGDETDPEVGANTTNRVSIWDGSALVSGIITDDGNSVGIGTDSLATGYLLSVDGRIICEELQILPSGSWPDYVFNKEYDLWSLEEVEKYIEMNNHLPGIPSAKCVEEDGISVGEMSKLLLEKMEELMLHVIEQSKQNAEQSKQLIDQAIQIKDLQKINVALLNKLNY